MNTYGKTACPQCGALNNMYRSLAVCRHIPTWDEVNCYNCNFEYKHTDKFNTGETESERIKREGRS